MKNRITNNFNDEVFYTSATRQDLKSEIRAEARKYNKLITDFKIERI